MSESSKKKDGWEKSKLEKEREKREPALLKATSTLLTYCPKKQEEIKATDLVELNQPVKYGMKFYNHSLNVASVINIFPY
jgi:hypothetical protein